MQPRTLLLDRDGVSTLIMVIVHHQQNFDFIDGIFELVRLAHNQN